MLEEDDKINPSDLSLKEEEYTLEDTVSQIPKFGPHLDQLLSTEPDKSSARHLMGVESKMRGMVLGEPNSASYSKFLKSSDESSPEDYSAQTALSNKRFLELKDLITNVTTESKRGVSDEMRKMHTETTKQIQNMHTEMIEQFTKNRKALVDIGKQVAEIRAHIELARIDRKDLDEVEARAINLEQFILSL
ncbi:hypothetical protein NW761_012312 [Fusarium oxysporum]|nr:hypothetical protein NW758_010779 [Fusarium oxysporum]KAJ4035534.1 hypothetical protein NW753_012042 [Fusarium oxysporum]KAJ4048116.1 hypothetical protein NW763_009526 [Fusarium oxysporum]KAJ4073683.1 hypothetical protein NW756_014132 [Fusarium oxysporum]KAJ4077334.1 hypothetical protein NW761_012312 [Fusarium oxysporum]